MSNTESISAKLRRWADESEEMVGNDTRSIKCIAEDETKTGCYGKDCHVCERELFRNIADEIDREMDELRDRFRVTHPMRAVGDIAAGKEVYPLLREAIERYFLPRPLFEDGEPVYIGAEIDDRKRGKIEVNRICYTDAGFYFNESHHSSGARCKVRGIKYKHGERVKRPKQPVLDADGVPIKAGNVLYRTTDGMKVIVAKLEKGHFVDGDGVGCNPSYFTHREPDTQERIDMDAQESSHDYWKCYGYACLKCPAMFDGKIPSEHYGVSSCLEAQKLDLLRRQRELDGRDA